MNNAQTDAHQRPKTPIRCQKKASLFYFGIRLQIGRDKASGLSRRANVSRAVSNRDAITSSCCSERLSIP